MKQPQRRFCCCSLFRICCCPPCSKKIPEQLILIPPSPPYYHLHPVEEGRLLFRLSSRCDSSVSRFILQQESRFVKTSRGHDIAVLFVRCRPQKRWTILHSHANAVDLGIMHRLYVKLSLVFGCDIVAYDYSGYGRSKGRPSEKNLYADIRAAWDYVLKFHEPDPMKIILYGQSIGTAATIDLASEVQCAGVILQSPFMSTMRVACAGQNRSKCMDRFKNIEKVAKVTSPVLVIHGTNDEIIDFSHGQAIYELCPRAVEPLWIEGAGHNDIHLHGQYGDRLFKFIYNELSN